MAKDRPVLGWGPDTYGYLAPTYQTQKFVDAFGPNQVINGAHNTFLQTVATKGVLGLAALFFFLVWLALRSVGAWRNARARERTDEGWREHRLMLTAALGATAGVLLQSSFNVELLGINIVFWAMAAVVSVVALAVGVPVGLNPASWFASHRPTRPRQPSRRDRTRTSLPAYAGRSAPRHRRRRRGRARGSRAPGGGPTGRSSPRSTAPSRSASGEPVVDGAGADRPLDVARLPPRDARATRRSRGIR